MPCGGRGLATASMSAGRPNRSTGMTAFVRGVIAAAIAAGSMFSVSGSTSTNTGRRAGLGDGLDAGVEGERHRDDLVARADAEGAQGDRQAVGAVGDADGPRRAEIRRGLILKALDVRPQDHAPAAQHVQHGALDALLQLGVLSLDVHQTDGHARASLGLESVADATTAPWSVTPRAACSVRAPMWPSLPCRRRRAPIRTGEVAGPV